NMRTYVGSLIETQTPLVIAGAVALLVPWRRLWPAAPDRRIVVVLATLVVSVWIFYFTFEVLPAWWYLRYMLPTFPFLLGGAAALAACVRETRRWVALPMVCGLIALGWYQVRLGDDRFVWIAGRGTARYIIAAQLARRVTPENSVILSTQHAGSVRYYGGRMT